MVFFQHRTIRRELMLIIMTISVLSIVLTSMAISLIHYYNYQDVLLHDAELTADVIAQRIEPLLGFSHVPNINQRLFNELESLKGNSAIALACLYDEQGQLLAFYDASQQKLTESLHTAENLKRIDNPNTCPNTAELQSSDKLSSAELTRFIGSLGNNGSFLYVKASLEAAYGHFAEQAITTITVCIGALIICYLLAAKLQHAISRPISNLSEATRNVVVYKDYSVRVANPSRQYSEDISQLIDSFNAMLKDIGDRDSKLQRKNLELERAKEMAESANLSKSQFLANISHELRTPLNAIIGFSSIIINQLFGPLGNDKYLSYAKDINESGVHLLDIINDILDLSKAEAGKLSLRLEELDVHEALKKCLQIVSERAAEAEVSLNIDAPAVLPKLVADRVRFIQIMLNLLSNAIKFTEAGGRIDIQAEFEPAGDEVHYFTFRVKDTGIGMRKEDIDMAFQTFGQVDSGLNRRYEGTGLGLPLTKKLVELHNGSIRIDSELHKGTNVSIRLISDRALL